MNLKKTIIVGILFTSLNSEANEEISYDWLEISYGDKLNGSLSEFVTLGGSFSISDKFYISADASRYKRFDLVNENSIGLRLGFHKALTDNTDFYTELGYRHTNLESLGSFGDIDFRIGTRSILSPKFELITHVEYENIDLEVFSDDFRFSHSHSGLNYGVKALYKMNKSSNISFGISADNSHVSPTIGYRFNW